MDPIKRKLIACLATALHPSTDNNSFQVAIGRSRALITSSGRSLTEIMDTAPAPTAASAQIQALMDQILALRTREASLSQDLVRAHSKINQQADQIASHEKLFATMEEFSTKFGGMAAQCESLLSRLNETESALRASRLREARLHGLLAAQGAAPQPLAA